jgi:hypothetical protein
MNQKLKNNNNRSIKMKKVSIQNLSRVQKAVEGTDGKTYYIPPKKPKTLPAGVQVKSGLGRFLKVTYVESK